jgi:hypothetical protein
MKRIINHWTAGTYKVTAADKSHYHFIIDGDANVVKGNHTVEANENTRDGEYAAHTQGCNTGAIGNSMCGMAGAVESPLDYGKYPIKREQWDALVALNARQCIEHKIPVTPQTVLSHAEVEPTLGIKQRGKWDISHVQFYPDLKGARAVGDKFRTEVKAKIAELSKPNPLVIQPKPVIKSRKVQSQALAFLGGGGAFSIAALNGFDWMSLLVILGAAILVGGVFFFMYRKEIEAGMFGPSK